MVFFPPKFDVSAAVAWNIGTNPDSPSLWCSRGKHHPALRRRASLTLEIIIKFLHLICKVFMSQIVWASFFFIQLQLFLLHSCIMPLKLSKGLGHSLMSVSLSSWIYIHSSPTRGRVTDDKSFISRAIWVFIDLNIYKFTMAMKW